MDQIISVVTPSFNQVEYIDDTILSVLSQQGDFLIDYIIIDGLSTDGSVDRIAWYEKELKEKCKVKQYNGLDFFVSDKPMHINRCKGISYRWVSEKDQGHGDALNKGFSRTTGDIMCWLNSDDVFLNDAFALITDIYSQFDHVKWTTALNVIIKKDGSRAPITHLGKHNYKNIYSFLTNDYEYIQQEATFWRRELWQKAGAFINTQYKLMVDGELWCRFFLHEQIYHINREIGAYRLHGSNRAHKYKIELEAEMRNAVLSLEKKVPSRIRDIAKDLTENAPGIVAANNDLDFMIIDKDARKSIWIIRKVDFFAYSSKRHAYKFSALSKKFEQVNSRYNNETVNLKNNLIEKETIIQKNIEYLKIKEAEKSQINESLKTFQQRLSDKDSIFRQIELNLTQKEAELKGNLEIIKQLRSNVQIQNEHLKYLEQYITEKDSLIAVLNEELAKKRELISEKSTLVENLQNKLTEKELIITEQAEVIGHFVQSIQQSNAAIQQQQMQLEKFGEKFGEVISLQLNQAALLSKTNQQLDDFKKIIHELNLTISELNEEVQTRDIELEKLRDNLLEKQRELDESDMAQTDLQNVIIKLKEQNHKQSVIVKEYKDLIHKVERSYSLRLGKALLYPAKQIKKLIYD